jgi:GH24 family phage-related lysozyme (muramidase)
MPEQARKDTMATQTSLDFSVVGPVAAWQHILNGCGYTPVLRITGEMDKATIKTTKKFQKDGGLDPTGEVDLKTWQAGLKHKKLPERLWRELPIPEVEDKSDSRADTSIPQCAIDLIKEFEGYHEELNDGTDRVRAYKDPGRGWEVPTIGYGTTYYPNGEKVKRGDIITRKQAEEYLQWEVEKKCKIALDKIPTWNQMNSNQRGALYSFAYNLGANFYRGSDFQSITRVCDLSGRWTDQQWIEDQFVKYNKCKSQVLDGLTRRRKAEAKLFCTPEN